MVRTIAIALFGLSLACAAQANAGRAGSSARQHDHASSHGLRRGQGHGQRCLPRQERLAMRKCARFAAVERVVPNLQPCIEGLVRA